MTLSKKVQVQKLLEKGIFDYKTINEKVNITIEKTELIINDYIDKLEITTEQMYNVHVKFNNFLNSHSDNILMINKLSEHSFIVSQLAHDIILKCNSEDAHNENFIPNSNIAYIASLSGLFHDIGKIENNVENHAELSVPIMKTILEKCNIPNIIIHLVGKTILTHSNKDPELVKTLDIFKKVLIEADILAKLTPQHILSSQDNTKSMQDNYNNIFKKLNKQVISNFTCITTIAGLSYYELMLPYYCDLIDIIGHQQDYLNTSKLNKLIMKKR